MSFFDKHELGIIFRQLKKNRVSFIGGILVVGYLVLIVAVTLFGNGMLPYDPFKQDLSNALQPPSWAHWFGTDDLGRDIFSRVIAGSPIDAEIAFIVVGASILLGSFLGSVSGYRGGMIEEGLMRVTDIFLAFPALVLAMALAIAIGPGIIHSMQALLVVWWPWYARLARAETLNVKNNQYVEAAEAAGVSDFLIILRHVIPNMILPLLVYATIDVSNVILTGSILSFIGLGAQAPQPEWGRMVYDGQDYLSSAWWFPIIPGVMIFIIVLAFSLFGDGLRDALDPRFRRR
jgi:peptide/nickel transport system permease protein